MSLQGTDLESEDPVPVQHVDDPTPPVEPPPDDEDGVVETVSVAGQKMVPLPELIKYRKEAREFKKQLDAVQPQLQQAQQVFQQLEQARPYIDAIRQHPELIEAAQKGTHASTATTAQPANDPEARELAEDMGWYDANGQLDVARGQRWLTKLDARQKRLAEAEVAPLRRQTVEQAANGMKARLYAMQDHQGAPVASKESLDEILSWLPAELIADGKVAFVAAMAAAGMDKYAGRTPTRPFTPQQPQYGAPIRTEAPGRRTTQASDPELMRLASRVGLTEKDLTVQGTRTRAGGVTLE